MGVPYLNVDIVNCVAIEPNSFLLVVFLAALCAVACIIFVVSGRWIRLGFAKIFKNAYVRVFVTGLIVIAITLAIGCQTYNGVGSDTIHFCLTDSTFKIVWWAVFAKILLTNISLGGGFQGGEIVPALFIGATLGNAFSQYFALDPLVAAALGMTGLFAAATKCPLASIAISFELFGFANPLYFIVTVIVSTLCSGSFRIYEEQRFTDLLPLQIGQFLASCRRR